NPLPALVGGAVWYLVIRFSGYVSVGSMVSLATVPVVFLIMGQPAAYFCMSAALALLAVLRHRSNISNLLEGKEGRVGSEE
ncbi:MAG TPA: glycerol-3-phosphate acyltransferase, partial [Thermovirgaceae bacterium]|nr:glycerol-3-phosphate acyltransferase [Thermovirgaceae bacterium]